MASNRSKSRTALKSRAALSFEMAVQLCPHASVAERVAEVFARS